MMQEQDTLTIAQQSERTELMDLEDDQNNPPKSLAIVYQEIKEEVISKLRARAEEKAKDILSILSSVDTLENYDDNNETYQFRQTTGEDEFTREPPLFNIEERVKEVQVAIDPN